MNIIKKLLEKIKIYLNNLFNRQNIKMIEATTSNESKEDTSNENAKEDRDAEKDNFFHIYNNVKNGTIKTTDLMINDLVKVMLMMQKEANIYNEKINNSEKQILDLETEINVLERQNQNLKQELNTNEL